MKLLIDTNVILDMVLKRKEYPTCMELFRKVMASGITAYLTASSITDLFYIVRKETHHTGQTYTIMENIFKLVAILPVTEQDIQNAFQQKWPDFEDCVQYMTGKNNHIDYIITNNPRDYTNALLPVMTPANYIEMMNHARNNPSA